MKKKSVMGTGKKKKKKVDESLVKKESQNVMCRAKEMKRNRKKKENELREKNESFADTLAVIIESRGNFWRVVQ